MLAKGIKNQYSRKEITHFEGLNSVPLASNKMSHFSGFFKKILIFSSSHVTVLKHVSYRLDKRGIVVPFPERTK